MRARGLVRFAKITWAAPCSVIGLFLATAVVLLGGRAKRAFGALEFTLRESDASCGNFERALPFRAIVLGHVIVAITEQELDRLRRHELVHVRQYERWGFAFFAAYAASSIWQFLNGRNPYWDNRFEVQARSLSAEPAARECGT